MGARLFLALTLLAASQQSLAAPPQQPHRLFADDQPIRVTLRGPFTAIVATPQNARTARPGTLELVTPAAEKHAILLSPRGFSRRNTDACKFPPLRVEFTTKPAKTSFFEGQHRLKLTTFCRMQTSHQTVVLMEYAAYRLFNVMSPISLRARLGSFDYVETTGRPYASRVGFFVEDSDDTASRNRLKEVRLTTRILPSQLDPAAAARAAVFEYMIGNLDWSMRAAQAGDVCCHNFKLLAGTASAQSALIAVPYDFDYSGFVNAPYALPPDRIPVSSVRERRYRGYCIHNAAALTAAAEFRSKRPELLGVLATIPQLGEGRRKNGAAYLEAFFRDIATDEDVSKRLLKTCIN